MAGFKAFTFKGKKTAAKAFHTLEDYSPEYYWLDDVAVVSRSKHGHLRVHSTWAQDESGSAGLGWGAFIPFLEAKDDHCYFEDKGAS